jgi:hypothetical protein
MAMLFTNDLRFINGLLCQLTVTFSVPCRLKPRQRGIRRAVMSFSEVEERYVEVVKALAAAIREEDPNRLIFVDGINIGQAPVLEIVDLGLVQSTRGYQPKAVSHDTATWVARDDTVCHCGTKRGGASLSGICAGISACWTVSAQTSATRTLRATSSSARWWSC